MSGCEVPDATPAELIPGEASQTDEVTSLIESWQDSICATLDPDAITEQMGIESYHDAGPAGLGLDESPHVGAVKCVASFRIGEFGGAPRDGTLQLVVSPNGSGEGAKTYYDERHTETAAVLKDTADQTPSWVLANRDLEPEEGPWAEGAIFALIPITGRTWFEGLYWDESYTVTIRLEWDEDTVLNLQLKEIMDGSDEEPHTRHEYDFTPRSLGEWLRDEYLPSSHAAISTAIQEGLGE